MSEEEIIEYLESYIQFHEFIDTGKPQDQELKQAIQGLLDLYTHKKGRVEELKQELLEEKEKNKELEKYDYRKIKLDDGEYYYCICDIFIGKDKVIRQDDEINCCKDLLDHNFSDYEVSILYDLITAGLVEKC